MPILTYTDRATADIRPASTPTVLVGFGAGDVTFTRRVLTEDIEGPVAYWIYTISQHPPGTILPPGSEPTDRPAVELWFESRADAARVLDFARAMLNVPPGDLPDAIRTDPRYTVQESPRRGES